MVTIGFPQSSNFKLVMCAPDCVSCQNSIANVLRENITAFLHNCGAKTVSAIKNV